MNELLLMRGTFEGKGANQPGAVELPAHCIVKAEEPRKLADDIDAIISFWDDETIDIDPLISVYYKKVVAKSNRVKRLLDPYGGNSTQTIVGARFSGTGVEARKHIMTHSVRRKTLVSAREILLLCAAKIEEHFDGEISQKTLASIDNNVLDKLGLGLKKSAFAQLMRDICFVEKLGVLQEAPQRNDAAFVTLFAIGKPVEDILREIGIKIETFRVLHDSVLLNKEQYELLRLKAPYLVAMSTEDLNELSLDDFDFDSSPKTEMPSLPQPTNEPIIGVIDTPFNDNVYFSNWVERVSKIDPSIPVDDLSKQHGTSVSSIIVDGPALNPELDDHCGRFRVRHFEVATGKFSSFSVMRTIEEIVVANPDIKVWNLSLGSKLEVNENSMSPEASILDRIQSENDVIFIIAGTNKTSDLDQTRIGAPADSINSIVVNSVDTNGEAADYSRRGPVLSFFEKPDVSYFGGTKERPILTAAPFGLVEKDGTSFATPWIARKIAYLIHVVGMTRESAKALLIDSAIGWSGDPIDVYRGHGVVPIDIREILQTKGDEIRFVINGIARDYESYNYNIPVPLKDDKCPYIARATLCYFPICNRNQGVDYTGTEMDLHFGQLKEAKIKPLNGNRQGIEGSYINEDDARRNFRKWDNVKHVSDQFKKNMRLRKTYGNNLWGVKIRKTTRNDRADNTPVPFGLVVTLKDITGTNRYNEFMQQCMMRGWLVNRIDINTQIDIYEAAEVDVEFED